MIGEIVIYKSSDGITDIDVRLENDTVWLTQEQMAQLFGTKRPAITKHINNIYDDEELASSSTCSILEHMGNDNTQRYQTKYYNLDMIISVGYRVKSKIATRFRQWATTILRSYLVKGYALDEKKLQNQRIQFEKLQQSIQLLQRTLENQTTELTNAQQLTSIISDFGKGLTLLDDYDNENLDNSGNTKKDAVRIEVSEFLYIIEKMKNNYSSSIFAQQKDESFNSSINQIYQTFNNNDCYPSLEEKAAMLLYLIVKNHSFIDGNKRIGASCFLYFLEKNGILNKNGVSIIDSSTLFALTLLIAESKTEEMETIKQVIVSVLNRGK